MPLSCLFKTACTLSCLVLAGCASNPPSDPASRPGPVRLNDLPVVGFMYSNLVAVFYDGPIRPLDEVAVVAFENGLRLVAVDGNQKPAVRRLGRSGFYGTGGNQSHFAPGTYQFEYCFNVASGNVVSACTSTLKQTVVLAAGQKDYFSLRFLPGRAWTVERRELTKTEFAPMQADFRKYIPQAQ